MIKIEAIHSYYYCNREKLSSYLLFFHCWKILCGLLHLNYFLFLTSNYLENDDPVLHQSFECSLLDWTISLHIVRKLCNLLVPARAFNIEKTTIFIFSFCIGLVTELNNSALGILKQHYIAKRIREVLIGNSGFLIQIF